MQPTVIVWDLETVPDLRGFAAANDLVGKSDVEVREALGDKFPKHIYHSIVCIGALIAYWESDHWASSGLMLRCSPCPGVRPPAPGAGAVKDSAFVAWYPSLYAPRTGGAYDSHHRTAGIAGRTRRRGRVATRRARAAASDAGDRG